MESKISQKSKSTHPRVRPPIDPEGITPREQRGLFYRKDNDCSLSEVRFPGNSGLSEVGLGALTLGGGIFGYIWFLSELSWCGEV